MRLSLPNTANILLEEVKLFVLVKLHPKRFFFSLYFVYSSIVFLSFFSQQCVELRLSQYTRRRSFYRFRNINSKYSFLFFLAGLRIRMFFEDRILVFYRRNRIRDFVGLLHQDPVFCRSTPPGSGFFVGLLHPDPVYCRSLLHPDPRFLGRRN